MGLPPAVCPYDQLERASAGRYKISEILVLDRIDVGIDAGGEELIPLDRRLTASPDILYDPPRGDPVQL